MHTCSGNMHAHLSKILTHHDIIKMHEFGIHKNMGEIHSTNWTGDWWD